MCWKLVDCRIARATAKRYSRSEPRSWVSCRSSTSSRWITDSLTKRSDSKWVPFVSNESKKRAAGNIKQQQHQSNTQQQHHSLLLFSNEKNWKKKYFSSAPPPPNFCWLFYFSFFFSSVFSSQLTNCFGLFLIIIPFSPSPPSCANSSRASDRKDVPFLFFPIQIHFSLFFVSSFSHLVPSILFGLYNFFSWQFFFLIQWRHTHPTPHPPPTFPSK